MAISKEKLIRYSVFSVYDYYKCHTIPLKIVKDNFIQKLTNGLESKTYMQLTRKINSPEELKKFDFGQNDPVMIYIANDSDVKVMVSYFAHVLFHYFFNHIHRFYQIEYNFDDENLKKLWFYACDHTVNKTLEKVFECNNMLYKFRTDKFYCFEDIKDIGPVENIYFKLKDKYQKLLDMKEQASNQQDNQENENNQMNDNIDNKKFKDMIKSGNEDLNVKIKYIDNSNEFDTKKVSIEELLQRDIDDIDMSDNLSMKNIFGDPNNISGPTHENKMNLDVMRESFKNILKEIGEGSNKYLNEFEFVDIDISVFKRLFKAEMESMFSGYQDVSMNPDLEYSENVSMMLDRNVILPKFVNKDPKGIGIVIDLSGSISKEELNLFMTILRDTVYKYDKVPVTLVTCTDEIIDIFDIYEKNDLMDIKIDGIGGTDLRPAILWFNENRPNYENILILTDTETPWPNANELNSRFKYFICISKLNYFRYRDFKLDWAKTLFF